LFFFPGFPPPGGEEGGGDDLFLVDYLFLFIFAIEYL